MDETNTNTASDSEDSVQSNNNNDEGAENDMNDAEAIVWPEVNLQKKDEGEAVVQLQKTLITLGYVVSEDGIYDDATTRAITDIQLQLDNVLAVGVYNAETRKALKNMDIKALETKIKPGKELSNERSEPVSGSDATETAMITNPYDQLALVNKANALPKDYVPIDLVVPDVRFPFEEDYPKKQLRKVAADALEALFAEADQAGITLFAQSGYRAYSTQVFLFNRYAEKHGVEEANKFSARPGESEHQTGLTMDVTSESVDFRLVTDFGETPEGQWIKEHAADFGFIIRYPEGKEDITLYQYEPWHLRYVGEKTAQEIMNNALTLEEYFNEK
nr:D-alanyl-D-alanine carboxypeptidase family protein [Lentibacillus saliphilus]